MGREVRIPFPPRRIVSLVPSQTELLYDLGLEPVGITKFCIHPADKVGSAMKIGGTKKLDLAKIRQLAPDLIIGNKEENEEIQIRELMAEFPVWMSDIHTLPEALEMIRACGDITDTKIPAAQLAEGIRSRFEELQARPPSTCAYLIWKDPYMAAGKETFIDDILNRAGFRNVIGQSRYPEISTDDLLNAGPDHIFLSSEPYPFKEQHADEFRRLLPQSNVSVVDGEMFSWYGSRLLLTADYLEGLNRSLHDL